MNFYAFKNRFKYGYKKFFAILFATLGLACEIAAFVLYFVKCVQYGETISALDIIHYIFMMAAFYYLLSGNIKGTTIAYRGFMIFVFYILFNFGYVLIQEIINNIPLLASGIPLFVGSAIVFLSFSALAFVSGLMTYLKFRSYQTFGKSTTYETVRNWCLVFTIMTVISYGALILLYFYVASASKVDLKEMIIDYLLVFIEPTAIIFIAICSYFTILRLRD